VYVVVAPVLLEIVPTPPIDQLIGAVLPVNVAAMAIVAPPALVVAVDGATVKVITGGRTAVMVTVAVSPAAAACSVAEPAVAGGV